MFAAVAVVTRSLTMSRDFSEGEQMVLKLCCKHFLTKLLLSAGSSC